MTSVALTFCNIQSHKFTQFTIEPGVNFILSTQNNAGKSTIFDTLRTIVSAPNVTSGKIDKLIRNDSVKAYVSATYTVEEEKEETVIAWFIRGEQGREASKLFFEYRVDGLVSRHVECPKNLVDALGIVRDKEGFALNFNDADSVQLIAKSSVTADSIITRVMLDESVEQIKDNCRSLTKDISADYNDLKSRMDTSKNILCKLEYVPSVDEFEASREELYAFCKAADALLPALELDDSELPDVEELELFHRVTNMMAPCMDLPEENHDLSELELFMRVTNMLSPALELDDDCSSEDDLNELKQWMGYANLFGNIYKQLVLFEKLTDEYNEAMGEVRKIKVEMARKLPVVQCPVKGDVYYTAEKCIPCSD